MGVDSDRIQVSVSSSLTGAPIRSEDWNHLDQMVYEVDYAALVTIGTGRRTGAVPGHLSHTVYRLGSGACGVPQVLHPVIMLG